MLSQKKLIEILQQQKSSVDSSIGTLQSTIDKLQVAHSTAVEECLQFKMKEQMAQEEIRKLQIELAEVKENTAVTALVNRTVDSFALSSEVDNNGDHVRIDSKANAEQQELAFRKIADIEIDK